MVHLKGYYKLSSVDDRQRQTVCSELLGKRPMPTIEQAHPAYTLAATTRKNWPDMKDTAGEILALFREYFQASRMLLPQAKIQKDSGDCVDKIKNNSNEIVKKLNETIDAVCE